MKPTLAVLLAAALLAAGCGGDDDAQVLPPDAGGGEMGPDAAPGATDAAAGPDVIPVTGPYANPSDFDHANCEPAGGVGEVSLPGIWHLDFHFDFYGDVASAIRFDPRAGGLELRAGSRSTDDVRVSEAEVFARIVQPEGDLVYAYDLCAKREDGSLFGNYARCQEGACLTGTFVAYQVEPIDEPVAAGVTLLGEWNGPPAAPWPVGWNTLALTVNVRVADDVAYVARYADGLRIADVSDPAHPVDLGWSPIAPGTDEVFNDVKLIDAGDERFALMASDVRGIVVIDVTNPQAPEEVTTFPSGGGGGGFGGDDVNVHTLFIEGTRAYLADISELGLVIYDLSDPRDPQPIGGWRDPRTDSEYGFVHDLSVQDGIVYLNYWNLGFVVLDATDAADPVELGVFDAYDRRASHSNWVTEAGGRRIAIHGDEDFYAHGRIIDVDPESDEFMTEIGSYQTRPYVSIHNIMASGELAFATYYQDGLRILDLSDPTDPQEVGHYATWPGYAADNDYGANFFEGGIGVDYDAARHRIFLADTHRGLLVLSLDP